MGEKIKGFDIQHLQNQEHFGFVTEFNLELNRSALEPLKPFVQKLTPLIAEEDKVLEMIAKSEHTKKLFELDQKCDDRYRGLNYCIKSALYSPDEKECQSAELLTIVTKTYGNFTGGSYENQHNKTLNFIQDFRSEKYKTASDVIGATRWINWLEEDDNKFMETFRLRRDEKAGQTIDFRPLRLIRIDINKLYREVVTHINAMAVLQPSEALTTLISRVNVHIDRLSSTMTSRSTRAANKNKKGGE